MKTLASLMTELNTISDQVKDTSKVKICVGWREITSYNLTFESTTKTWTLNFSAPESSGYRD